MVANKLSKMMPKRLNKVLHIGWLLASASLFAAEPWTFEQAISFALTNNPDARLAQHRMAAARAGLQQANAAFWPHVEVQSSYLRTDQPMLGFGSLL